MALLDMTNYILSGSAASGSAGVKGDNGDDLTIEHKTNSTILKMIMDNNPLH